MKKKSVAKIFALSLLKSVLGIIIILAVGFASYKISYTILSNNSEKVGTSSNERLRIFWMRLRQMRFLKILYM